MEVKVKKYPNTAAADRDAKRMAADGWEPQGMAGGGTRFAPGHGMVNKSIASALLGPVGIFASSRKEVPVTITWTRTPEAAAEADVRRQAAAAAAKEAKIAKAGGSEAVAKLIAKAEAGERLTLREMRMIPTDDLTAARVRAKQAKSAAGSSDSSATADGPSAVRRETVSSPFGPTARRKRREARRAGDGENVSLPEASPPPAPPPGWYADPSDEGTSRWWDGSQWSTETKEPEPPEL